MDEIYCAFLSDFDPKITKWKYEDRFKKPGLAGKI